MDDSLFVRLAKCFAIEATISTDRRSVRPSSSRSLNDLPFTYSITING